MIEITDFQSKFSTVLKCITSQLGISKAIIMSSSSRLIKTGSNYLWVDMEICPKNWRQMRLFKENLAELAQKSKKNNLLSLRKA